ncbi:type III pantothenate kinase [Flavobacterium silvaticum]|uniref:Type III pantothenate kinase n=1 Tax=Flavobacterium silvaticum TaxID=1852020 RepID=A0A972FJL4_9FLAO|nr:type III pantothenate kinase [Flavobacterium silvaticum]NMH27166.1 type III pantothenate kinase [Flavobacterium silvaticum]
MLLVIDIGNTRIKAAVFEDDRLIENFVSSADSIVGLIKKWLEIYPEIKKIITASVGNPELEGQIAFANISLYRFGPDSNYPIKNAYSTPKTVGIDRLILASGSVLSHPKKNRLVIDAGTCITYDFVDESDVYHGGAISPGIGLRYRSLNQYTARLPLLEKEMPVDFIGDSTSASIHSGVVQGVLNEIDGFIDLYRARYSNFIIILTGGDTLFLANRLKNTIFANPNFLLESLNQTYQFVLNDE